MTLYISTGGGFIRWTGQAINDVLHPLDIEQKWQAEDLAEIGLYIPADADPVPDGKVVASTSVQLVDGVVKFVNVLEDAPPPPVPDVVSPAQGRLALLAAGFLPNVEAAISQADEETKIWFNHAPEWHRDNPILISVGAGLGLSSADIDALFQQAVTYV